MLDKLWKAKQLPRVVLLYGRDGVAIHPLLLDLLRVIFCQQDDDFCQVCADCQAVENDRHDDLLQCLGEQRLTVADAGEIQEFLRIRSYQARVVVIDNVQRVTLAAANKLLKTLEEPPGERSFIFLLSDCYRQLLATITSRCFHYTVPGKSQVCDDYQQEFEGFLAAVDNNERAIAVRKLAKCPWQQLLFLFERHLNEKYKRLLASGQQLVKPVEIQLRRRRLREIRKVAVSQQIQLNMYLALENLLTHNEGC